jgi:hypothetical protein
LRVWDTSAVLPLLWREEGGDALQAVLAADGDMAVWWGTKVEAASAICRLRRSGGVDERSASRLLTQVEALISAAYEVQPVEEVRAAACRMLRVHELRAADALQLAAALVWADHQPAGMGFVCLDRQLRAAAEREGFDVHPG